MNRSYKTPSRRLGERHFGITLVFLAMVVLTWGTAEATIRKVPRDLATIQAGIAAALDGDTVLVAPGTYYENINFLGKAITVRSEQGPALTIIDGRLADVVARFVSHETASSVLSGFTLTHGLGAAIEINTASPTVSGNVLSDNFVCGMPGPGSIQISFGAPVIESNVLINSNWCDSLEAGGGISITGGDGTSGARILRNVIANHFARGISINSGGKMTIQDNAIIGNGFSLQGDGGGIEIGNYSDVAIINNVIVGNSARRGGGIAFLVPSGTRGPILVNNTIANNDSAEGSGVFADGFDAQALLVNNIIVAKTGQTAIYCGDFTKIDAPIIQFNDVFAPSGSAYGGNCTDQSGLNGNISKVPGFANPSAGDYRLLADSPAINAGTNAAPQLPRTDKDGGPRIMGGVVDMGAFEFPLPSEAKPVPTLSDRGFILLAALLALVAIIVLARRSKMAAQ